MKKIIAIIALVAVVSTTCFGKTRSPRAKVMEAVEDYSMCEGFDLMKIGSLGTALIKSVARLAVLTEDNDQDARQAIALIDGIRSIAIADYSSCQEEDKERFSASLNRIFRDFEPFMELKEDGDVLRMYGDYNEKTGVIRDFILYTPTDCALICIFGTISLDKAIELAHAE